MSMRIPKGWTVFRSYENLEHDRCVDIFRRPDGSFGFEEFRRDIEDAGIWTPVSWFLDATFEDEQAAMDAAAKNIVWFADWQSARGRR